MNSIFAQNIPIPTLQDTLKGSNTPQRSWWNVLYYDLTIKPDFLSKTIIGKNSITYLVVKRNHSDSIQIDLQEPLIIDSVLFYQKKLSFKKYGNAWYIIVPKRDQILQTITVCYSGKPKESIKAPWDGGIVWALDSLNRPWISVACQDVGASVWYPCKVYQGDKPDNGASISIIVPDSLMAVANGRLIYQKHHINGTNTYIWKVVNPINNYGITFYIGKYVDIHDSLQGEKGKLNIDYWVLDYNKARAKDYLVFEVHRTLKEFEYWFGAYPFYEDGYKLVEAPYIGMEHQSAIAYGNKFAHGRFGSNRLTFWDMKTDRMIVHESAHEWFGNNITAIDPADAWIQEGFAGYAEELAVEGFYGKRASGDFFEARTTNRISNEKPVISRHGIFENEGEDGFLKGWALIHMLRAIVNDNEKFRSILRGLNKYFYHQTVTSKQVEDYISKLSGMDLSTVFNQYLRDIRIPVLEYRIADNTLNYRFTNCIKDFKMPIKSVCNVCPMLHGTTNWQEISNNSAFKKDTLQIGKDFYIETKKAE